MMSKGHSNLRLMKQSDLLSIHRSGLYYKPKGGSELNLKLMREVDEHYLYHPFKGTKRMHVWLTKDRGEQRAEIEQNVSIVRLWGLESFYRVDILLVGINCIKLILICYEI